MEAPGARRLSTMVRHATHTFGLALWCVGVTGALRAGSPTLSLQVALAVLLALGYAAGLVLQSTHPAFSRRQVVGRAWVVWMLVVWAVLVALGPTWAWLCFPVLFLVLFILPSPASWLVVALTAIWAAVSPLLRGEHLTTGQVLGPVFGAAFAVVTSMIFAQFRRNEATQRAMADDLARMAAEKARSDEREALARDLHDTLAQGLNSIVMLTRATRAAHPAAADQLDVIEQTARTNLAQARQLVRRMAEPSSTLDAQVRQVVDEVAAASRAAGAGPAVELRVEGDARMASPRVQQAVVMAVRSLLGNVVQHAHAARCVVTLAWFDDELLLDVADDGIGFAPGSGRPDSFGLAALGGRMAELGGRVEVDSAPGEGTTVGLAFPLSTGDDDD